MNLISYRGCPFQVLRSNPIVREVVLDESNQSYKWTKWTISAIVTYNPAAVSFGTSDSGVGAGRNTRGTPAGSGMPDTSAGVPSPGGIFKTAQAQQGPNRMPADTDVAIRRFLEYPRGQLLILSTDMLTGLPSGPNSVVLRSPAQNPNGSFQACDANNGPFCKVNSIQEIAGERLWQIHLTFETYVYEDSLSSGQTPPVLVSNQWSVAVDTNWQHLTTRIIEGMVHFRADRLINTLNPAEALRSTFAAFTVPSGFQRKQVLCRTLASGNQVAYRIVDTEEPFQKKTTATVRLEYSESTWMWRGSFGRAVAQVGGAMVPKPWELVPGIGWAMWLLRQPPAAMNAGFAQLPKRYKTVIVRAWGNREQTRQRLITLALAVATSRMGTPALIDTTTNETIISYHSAQMMVQVQTTSKWSFSEAGGMFNPENLVNLANAVWGGNVPQGVGDLTFEHFIEQAENTQDMSIAPSSNARITFPYDSGTRGTWRTAVDPQLLQELTTQVLENIGSQNPGAPP